MRQWVKMRFVNPDLNHLAGIGWIQMVVGAVKTEIIVIHVKD